MTIEDDAGLRRILTEQRVIAMVGASPDATRPSHGVGEMLTAKGYRVIPVHPGHAGETLFGERVRANLAEVGRDLGAAVEMVDIFRRSDAVPRVVEEALAGLPGLKTVWMQIGVISPEARDMAEARGVEVVMDRCPKIEIARLGL
ncbi:hypothetical protein PSM7751_01308 [Pseudooceanicola marinus]|uniref:CoA-binding domain-containing protein n=1 Tax=Pseudooceanicola marinus TaxID=396013 RepID=A0A1X6YVA6_9RHOB|nr:CoA-binding protein [Pseudooceanicola marinus]PJE26179.1 CoA-binding protein [Pseudooceanicola marinus]SLN30561.1 hypothetical protein PSM7751_01308 [Pseudooceanicola marinus]